MRGHELTFTGLMHAILAINPFVLVSIVSGIVAFKTWLLAFSVAAALFLLVPAIIAFSYIPALAEVADSAHHRVTLQAER